MPRNSPINTEGVAYDRRQSGARPHRFRVLKPDGGYVCKSFASKLEGTKWAKGLRLSIVSGRNKADKRATLKTMGAEYVEALRDEGCTEKHIEYTERAIAVAIDAGANDMAAPDFALIIARTTRSMTASRSGQKTPLPASARTKQKWKTAISSVCAHAVNMQVLASNPLSGGRSPGQRSKANRIHKGKAKPSLAIEELQLLVSDEAKYPKRAIYHATKRAIATAGGDMSAAATALGIDKSTVYWRLSNMDTNEVEPYWVLGVIMAYQGCRIGQAVNLRWSDINFKDRLIRWDAAASGNKMGVEAWVPMEPELAHILSTETPVQGDMVCGHEITTARQDSMSVGFKRYLARLGILATAHALRHTRITVLTAMGFPTSDIMQRVGITDYKTIMTYTHQAEPYKARVKGWNGAFRLREGTTAERGALA